MFDLHRHDEYSTFDGFGKAKELAILAKELGYKSLCTTNHGNTNGLVQTYQACKDEGIKAILGVEGYFLPKYKEKKRGFHLCLIAKNLKGYGNLNRIQYEGEKQKYYNPIWDFDLLEKYHEGLICTTACVAGYLAFCIRNNRDDIAKKYLLKLKKIFGDDLYIEVQPYKVSEKGLQEQVNIKSILLAKELGIKLILTSDSHRGRKEDFPTYIKMHEIAGHGTMDIENTYKDRYMPEYDEMAKRFYIMHKNDLGKVTAKKLAKEMYKNLDEIEEKCEANYLDALPLNLPKLTQKKGQTSKEVLIEKIKTGLKERGKYKKKYLQRCKEELKVIFFHGFEDYFLIVADYANWAKSKGIAVGPGRGSVCNSLVAYALKITEVDSLFFNLDFRRFLRKDKSKFPDIDLDFETSRRHEVIEYLCNKYKGHAARICSYGLYKVDNLINDLSKVCGLVKIEDGKQVTNKEEIKKIKLLINKFIIDEKLDEEGLLSHPKGQYFNANYDNILIHFIKLFKKVRFIGTHAAGVAITGGNLLDYVALKIDKNGDIYTNYDLSDIEAINVIKFDILGLKTMESIGDLRKETNSFVDYTKEVNDPKIIDYFYKGKCDGIFQFEKQAARDILNNIHCDSFNDIVAASAMNRPGPLSLGMPSIYSENKINPENTKDTLWYEVTKESYGTIIYQEQVQRICVELAGMEWGDADKVMKFMKGGNMTEKSIRMQERYRNELLGKFSKGLKKLHNIPYSEAEQLFDDMTCYTFNKGHAVGYSLISVEEMYYKVYYPNEYWFAKLKYAKDDAEFAKFSGKAIADGSIIFLPHVNYSLEKTSLRSIDGEKVIQQGLSSIKGVGSKAAFAIEQERIKNGPYKDFDDLVDRIEKRNLNIRVQKLLISSGAVEFNKAKYINRVERYNASLLAKAGV